MDMIIDQIKLGQVYEKFCQARFHDHFVAGSSFNKT